MLTRRVSLRADVRFIEKRGSKCVPAIGRQSTDFTRLLEDVYKVAPIFYFINSVIVSAAPVICRHVGVGGDSRDGNFFNRQAPLVLLRNITTLLLLALLGQYIFPTAPLRAALAPHFVRAHKGPRLRAHCGRCGHLLCRCRTESLSTWRCALVRSHYVERQRLVGSRVNDFNHSLCVI